jgi:Uma2 family endonuclease
VTNVYGPAAVEEAWKGDDDTVAQVNRGGKPYEVEFAAPDGEPVAVVALEHSHLQQVGKSTLLRHESARRMTYVTLDDPLVLRIAREDPASFMQRRPPPPLVDQIQYPPPWRAPGPGLGYDANRNRRERSMGLLEEFAGLKHRISANAYHRMGDAGVIPPGSRVELIEGEIIDMAPIGSRHASVVNRLNMIIVAAVGQRAIVQVQGPVRLDEFSEPEPDIALLKPRADYYRDALPGAADVLLVIEVADSTQRYDRRVKVPLYARHAVPEVWVIDLENSLAHFHRRPGAGAYADVSATEGPAATPIAALPGVAIDLSGIL